MKFSLRIVVLLVLLGGTLADIEFDLSDFTDDDAKPTPPKPKEQPEKPNGGLDLLDPDVVPTKKPNKPSSGDSGGFDLNLEDDLGSDTNPKPDKPVVKPRKSGGDDGDPDLFDIIGGDYRPDGGRSGGRSGGGGAVDPGYDPHGGADQPQEAGSGAIAGIVSTIGVALLGAASSYFAYQKKKLCFKIQGGADPESGKGQHGTHSDPQVLSNLLRTN
uniref:CD99 molecule (Xg blood group) n=1 Tax=Lates calcarifer TaxID=8187 RepID=A0A4W6EEE0_LATCA